MIEDVVKNYTDANMPLEAIWLDIPYMVNYTDFTVDPKAFPSIQDYTEKVIHASGRRLVVILDAGISADNTEDEYYKLAMKKDCLIKTNLTENQKYYNGNIALKVWPNQTLFPDWFHSEAYDFWAYGLNSLKGKLDYDGLWIDMNEATGFCDGECPMTNNSDFRTDPICPNLMSGESMNWYCSFDGVKNESTYYVPFSPAYKFGWLDNMTLSLNATNRDDKRGKVYRQYDTHNLFAHMQGNATHRFLTTKGAYKNWEDRPFILSRSSFASSGRYMQHWLGDNHRAWNYMRYSIAGIMNMNMFGIPLVGADVCGFFGPKREDEMCARWIQLATYYPFARAHQNLTYMGNASDFSEPFTLAEPWKDVAKKALYNRYEFLRMQYTCLYEVHIDGGVCVAPTFFYYPEAEGAFKDIEQSFMVGNGKLMVVPVLKEGAKNVTGFFPQGNWTNINYLSDIVRVDDAKGKEVQVPVSPNYALAYLAPGALIPWQDNTKQTINST